MTMMMMLALEVVLMPIVEMMVTMIMMVEMSIMLMLITRMIVMMTPIVDRMVMLMLAVVMMHHADADPASDGGMALPPWEVGLR